MLALKIFFSEWCFSSWIVIPDKVKQKSYVNSECKLLGIMMTEYLQMLIHGTPGTQKQIKLDVVTVPMLHIRSSDQEMK